MNFRSSSGIRFIISLPILLFSSVLFAQSRGIRIVAVDGATKEWQEIALYDKTHAVIIGIDRYPQLSPDQQLTYAVSDAKAVERMLSGKFIFNEVYALYNEQATKSKIEDVLLNKLAEISKDDAVFIFFAGHGGQEKTDYGDIGYIVPYDGNFTDMRKVISMTTIRDDISKRIKAKHVFYVMDACYSGLLVAKRGKISKETGRDITYLKQITKEPVRQVLTAGDANQQVLDGGPNGHSVFTGRFLEILDSANDFITAEEISSQVKERVFSDANARGHVQTPQSGALFGLGDFIFMPSLTKRRGNIQQQISELESELRKLSELENRTRETQDEVARRELERERKVAEAQLQAKRLEEQRLEKERITREQQEQERQNKLSAQRKKEEQETIRLASLQRQVEEKRKTYKSSMILSLDEALRELQSLDKQINEIRADYLAELRKRIINIAENHSNSYDNVTLEKDEFESEAEYKQRINNQFVRLDSSNQQEFGNAMRTIKIAYEEQIAPFLQQIDELSNNGYTIYGHDALLIRLGEYDTDKECFKITVSSNNIGREIYSQGRMVAVSDVSGQARRLGIQKGDMIVSYNNMSITPDVDWTKIKQTVISDDVEMEIDRNGGLLKFALKKGTIGLEGTYVEDYAKDLQANQFIVNGELRIPRSEAREFKQDYLNGFITAELEVKPISHSMSLVTRAVIVDESSDKRYDLFRSRFIYMGNRLVYDNQDRLIWLTYYPKVLNWEGTNKYANRFEYRGLRGWKLPSYDQLKSLRNSSAYRYFNFASNWFHTSSKSSSSNNHIHYSPDNGSTGAQDSYSQYFILVIPWTKNAKQFYIYDDRFIILGDDLAFDTVGKLIWCTKPVTERTYTYLEAERFIKNLEYQNLRGWRLPSYQEFKSLYDHSIPGLSEIFNFASKWFHTSSKSSSSNNHIHYRPDNGSTGAQDSYSQYVIGVM